MPYTVLEQVSVIMQPQAESGLTEDFIIPIPSLTQSTSPGIVYVSFTRDSPEEYAAAAFQCILKFISKEVDPASGEPEADGYEDEYQLEDVCQLRPVKEVRRTITHRLKQRLRGVTEHERETNDKGGQRD